MEEVFSQKLPAYEAELPEAETTSREPRPEVTERVLPRINTPDDLKQLSRGQLRKLCEEIRAHVIDVVSHKGGHLGSSLGVVELTVALHAILDTPRDRLVWDVGHQAYVHKVLTGRRDKLWSIRQYKGISGFLKRSESPYDCYGAGHASTAISGALGLAAARDLAGGDYNVAAVIGDGAMTGGLAYEALNNAGQARRKLLVVLNDNGMSIAPNVGAIANYLADVTSNPRVRKLRDESMNIIEKLPALGEQVGEMAKRLEKAVKSFLLPGELFEALGFSYVGPIDGHDLEHMLDLLPKLLEREQPVLLHVLTRKGKGLAPAEADNESFHGVTPFDRVTGKALSASAEASAPPSYTKVFGRTMVEAAETFPQMVAITAAMTTGTGLTEFKDKYPTRFFDVGIAEEHAVCFAAGLACDGSRPVVAIYSTFLQRAIDQIVHDVALQKLPVVFAMDRGGLVGADGPTHHGILDLSYLRFVPGMVVAAPKDGNEMRDMLWTALQQPDGPFAFRYPRGNVPAGFDPEGVPKLLDIGSWEMLEQGRDVAFLAVGSMVGPALRARDLLASQGVSATVVNSRFIKPMDREMLQQLRASFPVLITVEENSLIGGFGDGVLEALNEEGLALNGVLRAGVPDEFVTHGSQRKLIEEVGLTPEHLAEMALRGLKNN